MKLTEQQKQKFIELSGQAVTLKIPYKFGAEVKTTDTLENLKESGIDCSEWTQWLYSQIGIDIVDGSYNQFNASVDISEIFADTGDLVFKRAIKDNNIGHVGMVLYINKIIYVTEAEGWFGKIIIRPLHSFKIETKNNIYAGSRRLKG